MQAADNVGLAPAADGGDDLIWISGPDEGLGVMVGLVEIAVDSGLEVDDRSEAGGRIASRLLSTAVATPSSACSAASRTSAASPLATTALATNFLAAVCIAATVSYWL